MKKIFEEISKAAKNSEAPSQPSKPATPPEGPADGGEAAGGGGKEGAEAEDAVQKSKKELSPMKKQVLTKNREVDIQRSSVSGISGGYNPEANVKKEVSTEVKSRSTQGQVSGTKTTLINEETGPARMKAEGQLVGGLENKAGTEDVNAGRVRGVVKDFGVAGGLAPAGGENIKHRVHKDVGKLEEAPKKISVGTNAGKEEVQNKAAVREKKGPPPPPTAAAPAAAVAAPAAVVAAERAREKGKEKEKGEGKAEEAGREDPRKGRKYEQKPVSKPCSDLSTEREKGAVLYETPAFKKRYFLQFLWTKRHFVITKDGRLKYYRDLDAQRRGEFSMKKEFIDAYPEDGTGKMGSRIVVQSEKQDRIGFETKEKRDEFMYWMDKAME